MKLVPSNGPIRVLIGLDWGQWEVLWLNRRQYVCVCDCDVFWFIFINTLWLLVRKHMLVCDRHRELKLGAASQPKPAKVKLVTFLTTLFRPLILFETGILFEKEPKSQRATLRRETNLETVTLRVRTLLRARTKEPHFAFCQIRLRTYLYA